MQTCPQSFIALKLQSWTDHWVAVAVGVALSCAFYKSLVSACTTKQVEHTQEMFQCAGFT